MKHSLWPNGLLRAALSALFLATLSCRAATGQIVDNPGFKALPRSINYATPLAPTGGVKAVIVYGRNAPWTQTAAKQIQRAVQAWCGQALEVRDDQTVTRDETWLLADAYRRTPLIVLGNCQDNRVLHALGTRYLEHSNRYWPGGDRYILRTVFEPFAADVNYLVLSASTEAGLQAAAARFAELLKTLPAVSASIPLTRIHGGGNDGWKPSSQPWKVPAGYAAASNESVTAIIHRAAAAHAELPPTAGEPLANVIGGTAMAYGAGGSLSMIPELPDDKTTLRSLAAYIMTACRSAGGRTHMPSHHYGGMTMITTLRGIFQSGILTEEEFNECENYLTLSGAYPNEYYYDHLGADSGFIDFVGGRHCMACLLITGHTLDYDLNHCRMDERTGKEIERRADGVHKATARYVRSFRDNGDTWELGESTMMFFYALLHQGFPEVIRNGTLRRMADMYLLTSDNLRHRYWRYIGLYAGLDGYIGASPGMLMESWHGRGLVAAAAFYYDDPQYRWFEYDSQQAGGIHGNFGSVATAMMRMHWDLSAPAAEPARLYGARALPFDPRLYDLAATSHGDKRWSTSNLLRVPAPIDRLADRATLRDGIAADDAYLYFCTSQRITPFNTPLQNNAIARYTDLNEVWLYHNSMFNTGWGRNVVSISNGKSYAPAVGCTLEALSDLGDLSVIAACEPGVAGADWTRAIVHWRGHYFAVLDTVRALADDEFNMVCRWRSPNLATLETNTWVALAGDSTMRIQPTDPMPQASDLWECDGSSRPYVLTQYKHAKLAKDSAVTFQNLIVVSGTNRPDAFTARRVSDTSLLVKGRTAQGEHLALIGTAGGTVPLADFETDAAVYYITGNTIQLIQATRLKTRVGNADHDVLRSEEPVNLLVDCITGKGLVEDTRLGKPDFISAAKPFQTDAASLPRPAATLATLWESTASAAAPPEARTEGEDPFKPIAVDTRLERPLRRLTRAGITSTPPANRALRELTDGQYTSALSGNAPTWGQTEDLTITLDLGRPVRVAQLRFVGTLNYVPLGPGFGSGQHAADDFTFGLALSDDGFSNDVRTVAQPRVHFEETALYPIWHYALGRLPTFALDVNAEARHLRITPRPAHKDRQGLFLNELEIYEDEPASELGVQAFAADVDGDGDNELVTGTTCRELAVFGSDGRLRWKTTLDADIFTMGCDDLDQDGKSEILVYTTREQLRRFNGDGSERPLGDVNAAYIRDAQWSGCGGMITLAAWAPDSVTNKEVMLWSEGCARVLGDGTVKTLKSGQPRGAGRMVNLWPGEPEVLVTAGFTVDFWSSRRDQDGNYIRLAGRPTAGEAGGPLMRGFGWVQAVDEPGHQGVLAANNGGLNYWPVEALATNREDAGWGFDNGGVQNVTALMDKSGPSGQPRVFVARLDGFVNVFDLDGKQLGLLNAEGPIVGMAMLKNREGQACLAVGTKFGIRLFGPDLKLIGHQILPAVAFAGPGGRDHDRVYAVDAAGVVTIRALR